MEIFEGKATNVALLYLMILLIPIYGVYGVYQYRKSYIDLPYVGIRPGLFGSWKAGYYYLHNSADVVWEGYQKYAREGSAFVISTPKRWLVFLTDPDQIAELAMVADSKIGFYEALNMAGRRSANRCFVGLPLCRNQELLDIFRAYAIRTNEVVYMVDLAPGMFQPLLEWVLLKRFRLPQRAMKILNPVFEERKRMREELGQERWDAEKPNDSITWIIDAAMKKDAHQQTNEQMSWRLIWLNFAAIHTTSMSTLHILYDLAANPEYIDPLREEIIATMDQHGGYTKEALNNMLKLDSCLRESQRWNCVVSIVISKLTMSDYTFKSGKVPLHLPKGTFVTAPATATHLSEEIYGPDAHIWKGFRFSEMREKMTNPEESSKLQAAATSKEYLAFSHGKHACTGRFFAIYQLKMLLIYCLLRYDIRLPLDRNGKRPDNRYILGRRSAEINGSLEFRERKEWNELKTRWGEFDEEED
ncbi:hypothetical protein TWF102_001892 [Orbilia oligospora]|uniref:Cytochrome P450 n=1 Tax=Orbilia oligospora TaxID=2813651 RepID=A0A7C8NI38_ORBOL|nr:hypothetical protein TWF706_009034 [Orbilia oligospora]KAF3102068.1 hypothetical protein TWF103_007715 [Orbilia oligospora]KAF3105992.1 hypothetical protein TWF102_001892 [Orbilia oligospora]